MAFLMVYLRYEYEGKLKEEFFFSAALPRRQQLVQKYQRLLLITLKTKDYTSRIALEYVPMVLLQ